MNYKYKFDLGKNAAIEHMSHAIRGVATLKDGDEVDYGLDGAHGIVLHSKIMRASDINNQLLQNYYYPAGRERNIFLAKLTADWPDFKPNEIITLVFMNTKADLKRKPTPPPVAPPKSSKKKAPAKKAKAKSVSSK
ncbi:MAG: hypothetical protein HN932_13055 [Candidatus Marinimicrobia bacterium]|jgi:hypothetical protein|nr:hypothetical protein [Candidatus Neomarinimicrobiota bacterium]MBT7339082.1 hypothetical protein [Candidatus Jacksonbacteria bacterium]